MLRKTIFYAVLFGVLMALIAAPAAAQDDPAEVVTSFYGWYLGYAGYDQDSEVFRNPLVDGSYQERSELSARMIDQVAAMRDEQGGFHYDPFLCAQDLPASFETELVEMRDQNATVMVREFFAWNARPNVLAVDLVNQDGAWHIDGVNCQETITPRGVTEAFYTWYLEQVPGGEGLQSSYPFLTDDLNARLAQTRQQPGGGDAVLCAQDFPVSVAVDVVMVGEDEATMLVREFFAGNPQPSALTVRLAHGEQWLIDDIMCQVAPETVVELLYNEFILFMRYDMIHGIDRAPIADWSPYPWAQYMGQDLLDDLLAQYRSGEARPADPFLCAQDIPARVDVALMDASSDGRVTLSISGAYPSGPETYATYELAVVEMALAPTGDWQMVNLTCAP